MLISLDISQDKVFQEVKDRLLNLEVSILDEIENP